MDVMIADDECGAVRSFSLSAALKLNTNFSIG